MQPYDVTIIGGGVVGCALAYTLAQYHVRVAVLEKQSEVGFGTSKANSGIIHAGFHSAPGTLKGRLEWAGNQRWQALARELDFGLRRRGEVMLALAPEQVPVLYSFQQRAEALGVPGVTLWNPITLRRYEPNVNGSVVAALYAPTTAVINPYEACFALISAAQQRGVDLATDTRVIGLHPASAGLEVETSTGTYASHFVINAAGLAADEIAALAGVQTFVIHPRKGEEYLLDKRLAGIVQHVVFPCPTPTSKGILVIPTVDDTIMVGPTAHDAASKNDLTTTAAGSDEVFRAVQTFIPGISERDCIAEFAGLRPAANGEDFIIGPTTLPSFINAAGIQSPGLTAAPAIAEMLVAALRDAGLALERHTTPAAPVRKRPRMARLAIDEQMRLSAQDRRYSHILCRCEGVSEGELLDAIQDGAHTLDGLKFRTRAGMGRCQGGFCTWRCLLLLAQELGVPLTDLTKHGAGSWVVCPRMPTKGTAA